jgi:hypothetical protein
MRERKNGSRAGGTESSSALSKRSYSARLDEDLLAQRRRAGVKPIGTAIGRPACKLVGWHNHQGMTFLSFQNFPVSV